MEFTAKGMLMDLNSPHFSKAYSPMVSTEFNTTVFKLIAPLKA